MPTTDLAKQTITVKNFQVWFYRMVHNRSREDVAAMYGITDDAVDYHVNEVNRLGQLYEARQNVQDALLCLVPVAIEALEKKLREGDVHAINALLKGLGVYVTREKQYMNLNQTFVIEHDPDRRLEDVAMEILESRGYKLIEPPEESVAEIGDQSLEQATEQSLPVTILP